MKKTRFFYGKNYFLLVLLGWLLLLDGAVRQNRGQEPLAEETGGQAVEPAGTSEKTVAMAEETYPDASEERERVSVEDPPGAEEPPKPAGTESEPESEDMPAAEEAESEPADMPAAEEQEPENPDIRVLLMDSSFQSCYHPSVTVRTEGRTLSYTPESPELKDEPLILSGNGTGIEILSLTRQENPPVYEGSLTITAREEGLLLVNTLPLESYLEAVVPSEMPSFYEPEALKAQAVCARTYATKQMEERSLPEEYGADVDDSVNFQVYQNCAPSEAATRAVRETAGQVMTQEGELINAYYFSTSAGCTSTDEVWGVEEVSPYLKSVACGFDKEEPWSRWSVSLPWDTVNDRACGISGCGGALTGVEIVRKSQSGAVTELLVTTEGGSGTVLTEYEVRSFLSPKGLAVTEKDGTEAKGGALLPSAYFTLEANPGESLVIRGAGYGHGVGMSQTAANQMAKEGYGYEEILDYFFKDIEITRE